jgi:hypothetical protein
MVTIRGGVAMADVGPSHQDQPETDYDLGPTQLYTYIENKNWDNAIERTKSGVPPQISKDSLSWMMEL